ncbi:hypothetical protein [Pareuzebyella sediminis]|uniref:hypothetical protein n=1 Tax=Pareuzebyella sediminis TaxID=2607998 RepID=UPI0011EC226A|nr:hypothetical protein [Pareuzebyella sediminis]
MLSPKNSAKNAMVFRTLLISAAGFLFIGCNSTKRIAQETILLGPGERAIPTPRGQSSTGTTAYTYDFDDHDFIRLEPVPIKPILPNGENIAEQLETATEAIEVSALVDSDFKSPVADKIVENYINSDNKEPEGHCLEVSKSRFEKAYKEVYGHSPYQDLPDSMATQKFTPKRVFDLLYVSASKTDQDWRSLPEKYRGKGNAGALAYAGMGTLVDSSGIWSGQLRPGALMQVWRFKEDYERVAEGVDVKKIDPYGHSFIFISYVRDEKNAIVGLKIADQGFQSYRPLIPRDYEVWWGVNLTI